ncbi:hypothetical protein [Serratia fonticola]
MIDKERKFAGRNPGIVITYSRFPVIDAVQAAVDHLRDRRDICTESAAFIRKPEPAGSAH